MMVLEIFVAIVLAKWGGDLASSRGYDEFSTKLIGWLFLLAGIAIAFAVGDRAHATPAIVISPVTFTRQWTPAPLVDGGFARCKADGGCHGLASDYPAIIAQQGDVRMYGWNGVNADNRQIAAIWPLGDYKSSIPYVGVEGFADEWEGVKPA